ncbi:MAG: FKBP-type peptidyl-prolyl cis-trans isomerase [Dysgonomonas sp.]
MKVKKMILFVSAALIGGANLFAQSNSVQLKTEADSISYAYGASLFKQGMQYFLIQNKVLGDTAAVRYQYEELIRRETDANKVNVLKNELRLKQDSIVNANRKNTPEFLKGLLSSLNSNEDVNYYAEGVGIGSQINKMMVPQFAGQLFPDNPTAVNREMIFEGIKDAMTDNNSGKYFFLDSPEKFIEVKVEQKSKDKTDAAKKFMEENKKKKGIVTMPSGLQYKVVTMGTGAKPTEADQVRVHYKGMLTDGTVFDSSYNRGEPAVFGVGQVIKGWTEALQLMPVGSKWILYIPYDLAYDSREAGQIKPFSNLIFEVELLDIVK